MLNRLQRTLAIALIAFCVALPLTLTTVGCKSTPQRVAYNALYTTEQTVVTAFDAYLYSVVKGGVATNDVPKVSAAFNRYQAAMGGAVTLAGFDWSAPTPPEVARLAADVLLTIQQARAK